MCFLKGRGANPSYPVFVHIMPESLQGSGTNAFPLFRKGDRIPEPCTEDQHTMDLCSGVFRGKAGADQSICHYIDLLASCRVERQEQQRLLSCGSAIWETEEEFLPSPCSRGTILSLARCVGCGMGLGF